MANYVDRSGDGNGGPAAHAYLIAPVDGVSLPFLPRALYVGGTGNVAVLMLGGETVTFVGVPTGSVLPIRVTQVLATGTTATYILALY